VNSPVDLCSNSFGWLQKQAPITSPMHL